MKQIVITTEHRQAIITNLDDAACLGRLADAELCEKFLCAEHTLDEHFDAATGALAAKHPRRTNARVVAYAQVARRQQLRQVDELALSDLDRKSVVWGTTWSEIEKLECRRILKPT